MADDVHTTLPAAAQRCESHLRAEIVPPPGNDRRLRRLLARAERLGRRHRQEDARPKVAGSLSALRPQIWFFLQRDYLHSAAVLPAVTAAGRLAKAQAVSAWMAEIMMGDTPTPEAELMASLVHDLALAVQA